MDRPRLTSQLVDCILGFIGGSIGAVTGLIDGTPMIPSSRTVCCGGALRDLLRKL